MSGFLCTTCGKQHDDLPMCFGPRAPDLWYSMPDSERNERGELSSDQCVIDDKHYFVLGRILIPVIDSATPFTWLAWVSLSEMNFNRVCELWESEGRECEPPYFGWLQSTLPYESSTMNLKTKIQTMPLGERPNILLEQSIHPLSIEQRTGITMIRAQQLAEAALHG